MIAPRILIVEDELFVAVDLEAVVHKHNNAAQIVCCSSIVEARQALEYPVTLALLDVDVVDGKTFGLAEELTEKGVPIAFVSGSRPEDLPRNLAHVYFVPKPFTGPAIREALERIASRNEL